MDPFASVPDPSTPTESLLIVSETAPDVPTRPKRGRLVAIVAAVAVVAAGGVVVATNLGSSEGGYDSPDAAVQALLKAANQSDILGLVDVMRPGERAMLRDTMLPLEKEMERLQVLGPNVDMHKLPGLEVQIDGVTTSTEAVGDRVAVVTMESGQITGAARLAELPLGKILRDQIKPGATDPSKSVAQLRGKQIATVKEDGRWYVSLTYSIAESARRSAGMPAPDLAHPIPAVGAADPEAAARGMATSLAKLDLAGAIGLLAPSEFGALQDYGTLFVPDAQKSVDQWKSDSGVTIGLTLGAAKVDQQGDHATVAFGDYKFTFQHDTDTVSVTVDAQKCVTLDSTVSGETKHQHVCPGNSTADSANVPADVKPTLERLKGASLRAVVVKERGRWYVAPIRSMFDLVGQALAAFNTVDDAKAVLKWAKDSINSSINSSLSGVLGGGSDSSSGSGSSSGSSGYNPTDGWPADLVAFDEYYRAHLVPNSAPEVTMNSLTVVPSSIRFIDSSLKFLPPGDFTSVIGAESTMDGAPVCIMLSLDAQSPGFHMPCPPS
ncbi:MAG: hypothetical protein WCI22_11750 [Actinomycetota bacterium]